MIDVDLWDGDTQVSDTDGSWTLMEAGHSKVHRHILANGPWWWWEGGSRVGWDERYSGVQWPGGQALVSLFRCQALPSFTWVLLYCFFFFVLLQLLPVHGPVACPLAYRFHRVLLFYSCPTAFLCVLLPFMCPTAILCVLLPLHGSYCLFMCLTTFSWVLIWSYCLCMCPTAFSWVLLPFHGSYCFCVGPTAFFMCPTAFHWSYFLCIDPTTFAWVLLLSFVLLQLLPVPGPLAYSSHGVWHVAVLLVSYCLFIVSYCFFPLCPTAFVRILLLLTVSYCFFSVSCC